MRQSNFIKKIKDSKYFRALAVLMSGTVTGTLFIAVHEVLQTRIFTSDEIGIYTFLLALPLTFISVMSLRYDVSIITEKDLHSALVCVKLSALINCIITVAATFVYVIYIVFFHQDYIRYLYLLPFIALIMFGYGLNNILTSFNNRTKEFALISKMYVLRTFIQHIGVLIVGFIFVKLLSLRSLSIFIMVVPYALGLFAGVVRQSKTLMVHLKELKGITKSEMIEAAKDNKMQPLVSTPALFVNSFSFSVITMIIESLFGASVLGYYSVSSRVLGMPISLVSGNVAKVFIQQASVEYTKTGKFIKAYKQSMLFLVAVSVPMFLAMFFLAPPLCEMVFGDGWGVAGEYIKILAPMFSFRLIGSSISQSLVVCKKQHLEMVFNILLCGASIGSGIVARIMGADITVFLVLLCLTRSLAYIWLIIIVYINSKGVKKHD